VCDLETSRMGAPYIYDISRLRVKDLHSATYIYVVRRLRVKKLTVPQLVKKFLAFYGTQRFNTALTKASHMFHSCIPSL